MTIGRQVWFLGDICLVFIYSVARHDAIKEQFQKIALKLFNKSGKVKFSSDYVAKEMFNGLCKIAWSWSIAINLV